MNRNEPNARSRRQNDIIEDPKEDLMDDEFAEEKKSKELNQPEVDSIGEQSEEEVKQIDDENFGVYIGG
jgi:hypothetical protein